MLQHVRDAGSGGVLVQKSSQSIDQAVDEVLEQTRESAEKTSEQDLDLQGFDGAQMATFSYDATGKPFLVAVVAVGRRPAGRRAHDPRGGPGRAAGGGVLPERALPPFLGNRSHQELERIARTMRLVPHDVWRRYGGAPQFLQVIGHGGTRSWRTAAQDPSVP